MKFIVVDDERLAVENLIGTLLKINPSDNGVGFFDVESALGYIEANHVDVAFLDIEMSEMDGLALARKFTEVCPQINIIFVTGHSQYSLDAFKLHASGYLLKPVREQDLRRELANLRYPIKENQLRVRIQTFGNFQVFVDGKPLEFPRSRCKECLAYLVDRKGAMVALRELAAILWEDKLYDRTTQNNIHQIIFSMMQTLKEEGIQDIIIKHHKEIGINVNMVDCDYYRFLNKDSQIINTFTGEYMSNYSWAEFTVGELIRQQEVYQKI